MFAIAVADVAQSKAVTCGRFDGMDSI